MKTYNERTQDILKKAEEGKAKRIKTVKLTSIIASVCAVMLAFNLFMFVPYREGGVNIAKYKNNEYYAVIKKVNDLTYGQVEKKSNFQRVAESVSGFFGLFLKGANSSDGHTGAAPGSEARPAYEEVTNNQTDGVIEGDLFKRSSENIYYLASGGAYYKGDDRISETFGSLKGNDYSWCQEYRLQVYPIDGADTKKTAEFIIGEKGGMSFSGYTAEREMFLSADCTTATIISPCYNYESGIRYTAVISVDVSDTKNIKEINRTYISGQYISSRIKNGELLLVSNYTVSRKPDFSDKMQYLPHTGTPDGFTTLPLEDIICPDNANSANYTIICSLDEKTLNMNDCEAFMSFSDEVYFSESNMFVTRSYTKGFAVSQIYCLTYGGGELEFTGSFEVDGTILNRYCMDEYEGVLRVFTDVSYPADDYKGASLYCIDLESFQTIASVERFAPDGENVKSARFDKGTAYVCTAITIVVNTDPVFAFDLSDYDNITYKDTGTIPGYSLSLTKFKDDTLLGIGYGEWRSVLKIELYRESGSSVESVTAYEQNANYFSEEYKAHFIDAQRGLIGLGILNYYDFSGYIVLRFDGYELKEAARVAFENITCDDMRACIVDGYMYIFGNNEFKVIDANTL